MPPLLHAILLIPLLGEHWIRSQYGKSINASIFFIPNSLFLVA